MHGITGWLVSAFVAVGGIGIVIHLAVSHLKEGTKDSIIWLCTKYPALKAFIATHGPEIVEAAQAISDGVKDAVDEESQGK